MIKNKSFTRFVLVALLAVIALPGIVRADVELIIESPALTTYQSRRADLVWRLREYQRSHIDYVVPETVFSGPGFVFVRPAQVVRFHPVAENIVRQLEALDTQIIAERERVRAIRMAERAGRLDRPEIIVDERRPAFNNRRGDRVIVETPVGPEVLVEGRRRHREDRRPGVGVVREVGAF